MLVRPFYETDQDRAFEDFFCKKLVPDHEFQKVHLAYGFDFISFKKSVVAELKCRRNYAIQELPEKQLILSLHKVNNMLNYQNNLGLTAMLYVAGKDGLWYTKVNEFVRVNSAYFGNEAPYLTFSGRRDRNDSGDVEPCVRYDVTDMIQLYTYDQLLQLRKEYNDGQIQTPSEAVD